MEAEKRLAGASASDLFHNHANPVSAADGAVNMQAFATASVLTFACSLGVSIMFAQPALGQIQGDDKLPILYGAKLDGSQIAIDVVSFGCTDASYFSLQLDPISADSFRLSIVGRRQDRCRMATHIVTVTLEIPAITKLAEVKFLLMNRLATPNTLRRSAP